MTPQIKIPDSIPASDAHMLYKPCTRMLVYMIIWSSQYCIRTSNKVICNRIKDLRFELHLYKNQLMFELMINNIHHRIVWNYIIKKIWYLPYKFFFFYKSSRSNLTAEYVEEWKYFMLRQKDERLIELLTYHSSNDHHHLFMEQVKSMFRYVVYIAKENKTLWLARTLIYVFRVLRT